MSDDAMKNLDEQFKNIPEETREAIMAAFNESVDKKANELLEREKSRMEKDLMESMSGKVGHNVNNLIDASGKMISEELNSKFNDVDTALMEESDKLRDGLEAERTRMKAVMEMQMGKLREKEEKLDEERNEIAAARNDLRDEIKELQETKEKYTDVVTNKLAEFGNRATDMIENVLRSEVTQVNNDRIQNDRSNKLLKERIENFVGDEVASEIGKLKEERVALEAARSRMKRDRRNVLENARREFLANAEGKMNETINDVLTTELIALKEDIQRAKENDFARDIFESVARVYHTSVYNEKSQLKNYETTIDKLQESLNRKNGIINGKNREIAQAKRNAIIQELISPLDESQKKLMENLLNNTKTDELEMKFNESLDYVLEKSGSSASHVNDSDMEEIRLAEDCGIPDSKNWNVVNGDTRGNALHALPRKDQDPLDPEIKRLGVLATTIGDDNV